MQRRRSSGQRTKALSLRWRNKRAKAVQGLQATSNTGAGVETVGTNEGSRGTDQLRRRSKVSSKRQRRSLRAGLAVISGRAVGALSRRLHLGGGTSVVGLVAQRLHPGIVGHLVSQLEHGSVTVTGTNGKTTTSGFIAAILRDAGLRVWRNREGSNLMGGLASLLVMRALPDGQLRKAGRAISIFEVDEAVAPQAIRIVRPRVAVFTNLFRDQLDRYGEVESVLALWRETIRALSPETVLALNADDPSIASLGADFAGRVLYFGVDGSPALPGLWNDNGTGEQHQVVDTRACPRCGSEYDYEKRFYSHLGHYFCKQCGMKRPRPDVRAVQVRSGEFERLLVRVATDARQQEVVIPLPGLYNVYNALAAITVALALQVSWEPIVTGIEQFKPIFGRGERVQAEGRTLRLLLAKNPTGMNEVLRTLFNDEARYHFLFVLNDNIADGRDISWIWDVDFEVFARDKLQIKTLVVAGTRAYDLALRLKYAGIDEQAMVIMPPRPLRAQKARHGQHQQREQVATAAKRARLRGFAPRLSTAEDGAATGASPEGMARSDYGLTAALDRAIQQTPVGETLYIVPTYTGLLAVQRELERRGLIPHYWEGRDQ